MKYHITTFGCQQNEADSERIAGYFEARGYKKAEKIEDADAIVINTCVIREQAEDRVYGLVNNLKPLKDKNPNLKITVTGCLVGAAAREPTGIFLKKLQKRLPQVDEFLPLEEVGFDYQAIRSGGTHAWVPISNGCNNFCTFCIVPFSRGREVSRPFEDIVNEVKQLAKEGFKQITLLGQNVNSYGADLILGQNNIQKIRDISGKTYFDSKVEKKWNGKIFKLKNGKKVIPASIKHLGRYRIPTLFPYLLEELAKISKIEKISFLSSNPWDFSDRLIEVIAKNPKISREIHLPVQAGDDEILRRMNRWYSRDQYLKLTCKLKKKIPGVKISTDIIVGFPGETNKQFENTLNLAREVGFSKAFVAKYSPRPGTAAWKAFEDDVSHIEKTRRFHLLNQLVNKPHN
ncbi:MAG TPA: MiaB/RimO family radical SAM methylthiotransferase [Patescibacteria group bacterium]